MPLTRKQKRWAIGGGVVAVAGVAGYEIWRHLGRGGYGHGHGHHRLRGGDVDGGGEGGTAGESQFTPTPGGGALVQENARGEYGPPQRHHRHHHHGHHHRHHEEEHARGVY